MEQTIHFAIQYLISAQHSFVKFANPSFLNRLWPCADELCVKTYELQPHTKHQIILQFNYDDFSLEWKSSDAGSKKLKLKNVSHKAVVEWIEATAIDFSIRLPFIYISNKELSYPEITNSYVFKIPDEQKLKAHIAFQTTTQKVLEDVTQEYDFKTEVSIWNNTQNLSLYAMVNLEMDIVLNMGMSIKESSKPDENYCVYIKEWKGMNAGALYEKHQYETKVTNAYPKESTLFINRPDMNLIKDFFLNEIQKHAN